MKKVAIAIMFFTFVGGAYLYGEHKEKQGYKKGREDFNYSDVIQHYNVEKLSKSQKDIIKALEDRLDKNKPISIKGGGEYEGVLDITFTNKKGEKIETSQIFSHVKSDYKKLSKEGKIELSEFVNYMQKVHNADITF